MSTFVPNANDARQSEWQNANLRAMLLRSYLDEVPRCHDVFGHLFVRAGVNKNP
jgi:hypothetical protein